MRTDAIRAIERASKQRRATAFRALGLTSRGARYKYPRLTEAERKLRALKRYHDRARSRFALGLNSRGKQRVYLIMVSAPDAAVLEAEINNLVGSIANIFESLPPQAQSHAVRLGHAISNLRRNISIAQKEDSKQ